MHQQLHPVRSHSGLLLRPSWSQDTGLWPRPQSLDTGRAAARFYIHMTGLPGRNLHISRVNHVRVVAPYFADMLCCLCDLVFLLFVHNLHTCKKSPSKMMGWNYFIQNIQGDWKI